MLGGQAAGGGGWLNLAGLLVLPGKRTALRPTGQAFDACWLTQSPRGWCVDGSGQGDVEGGMGRLHKKRLARKFSSTLTLTL